MAYWFRNGWEWGGGVVASWEGVYRADHGMHGRGRGGAGDGAMYASGSLL